MNKKTKSLVSIILLVVLVASAVLCFRQCSSGSTSATALLTREDWSDDVKTAINDFISTYGNQGNYIVTDFDNTCTIFDNEEQVQRYMIERMAFAMTPEELPVMLASEIGDLDEDRTEYGHLEGSYRDAITDLTVAYDHLWKSYGPFSYEGVPEEKLDELHEDPYWNEFATKIVVLQSLIDDCESTLISYPWVNYWFTGMTADELYDLSYRSYEANSVVETFSYRWDTPDDFSSLSGDATFISLGGANVTENAKELWRCLDANGIDVWVCSASAVDVVRAAVDAAGMHDYCKGVLAYTNKKDADGRYICEYNYETGYGSYCNEDGSWSTMEYAENAQPQGKGKTNAVVNAILPLYDGKGPAAGFGDATGDFNFCTEFDSLKLVVCYNRATRKVTEGGGLMAEIAMYEKDTLGYDLKSANAAGDTLYVLQGRDENGLRSLRNSNKTIRFNETEETLFCNEDNYAQLQYMIDNKMSVEDICSTFSIKTAEEDSELGFKYGFLDSYDGYKSIK